MITLSTVILIVMTHFLADFGLQTHEQATGKSSNEKQLMWHVAVYSGVWLFMSYCLFQNAFLSIIFAVITYICHYITDYFSSRIGKPYWEKKDLHNGFVIIGADQVLHMIQLFALYKALS